jgi:hypothetical protein
MRSGGGRRGSLLALATLALSGCGGTVRGDPLAGLPADERPVPIGRAAGFRLPAVSAAVAARAPVDGLRCSRAPGRPYAVHLELYARRLVLPVPAGIGIAPPQRRSGAYVRGGACVYGVRTVEPTGVVLVQRSAGPVPRLAALFDVWGRPLSTSRLAGFRGQVRGFLDGRPWRGDPRAIPLRPHAEIVLEVGGYVIPHRTYRFPPGL